jgi:hypothetical protein
MKFVKAPVVWLALNLFLSACAIGPLVSHETARTVGKANNEIVAGYGNASYVFKWNFGLSDNLDFGLHWEALSIGLRAKYAFLNQSAGWSWAGALGIGESFGGNHYYGDVIGSFKTGSWEPYGTTRFVHVKNDPLEVKDENTGVVEFTLGLEEYDYGQFILGTRYWFGPKVMMSIEASKLFSFTKGVDFSDTLVVGAALGFRIE